MYQPDIPLPKAQPEPQPEFASPPPISIEHRSASDTVFLVDEVPLSSAMPRPTHWSIAWSDLMMTMFVLFLSMFVYQTAQMDFLTKEEPEIIGGNTAEALDSERFSGNGLPFEPIDPSLPLMASGTVAKAEPVASHTTDPDQVFSTAGSPLEELPPLQNVTLVKEESSAFLVESPADKPLPAADLTEIIEPHPLQADPSSALTHFNDVYRLIKETLATNSLEKFASLELVQDSTMRIILTGDSLFSPGKADLSLNSIASLEKIATAIKQTPYIINVVGHTDNVPMRSDSYASNWELSLARAGTVARFLIEDMRMNPNQFVVSGYSSFRPLAPNTNTANRAKNRRVEIIISKRLPQPVPAAQENLL